MKTIEELNALKEEYTELNKKLAELSEDDLTQVVGGIKVYPENQKCPFCGQKFEHQYFYRHLMECVKKNN